jgi:pilus assembly protein CpaF
MPLTIAPPSSPEPEDNNNENNKPQKLTGIPPKLGGGLPATPPPSLKIEELKEGKDLDAENVFAEAQDKRQFYDIDVNEELNLNTYKGISALSAQEATENDYDLYYKHLEPKVEEVKAWLQDILTENKKTEDVAEARRYRGEKYKAMKDYIDVLLVRYFSQGAIIRNEDAAIVSAMVINEILGLGPIEPLWLDNRITEIMVNGPFRVRIEINGRLQDAKGVRFRNQAHLLETCQQILAPLGKAIDVAHPFEDGRLVDGSRINATHPVIGPKGPYLTIRRFPETVFDIRRLISMGSMTEEMAEVIGWLVHSGCSTIVAGGTGSGKTSMLNALSGCIPDDERIITIEDNLELRLHPGRDVVAMEARKSHQGERGNVSIRDLVVNSLRQRPDRIIVGEVRDGSAYDMLQAMNTGHEGSMTTVHANDAEGAISRLVNLISEVGELDSNQALSLISNGVDIIVAIGRYEDGSRRVATISEVPSTVEAEKGVSTLKPNILFEFVQTGTDEFGKIQGEYRKVGELSPLIVKKHRLDKKPKLNIEEVYKLSDQSENQ